MRIDDRIIKAFSRAYAGETIKLEFDDEAAARAMKERFYWTRRQPPVRDDPKLGLMCRGVRVRVSGSRLILEKNPLSILDSI